MAHGITDALLIYNPTSGRRRRRRFVEIEQSVRILKEAGIEAELAPTTGPGHAKEIARLAVEDVYKRQVCFHRARLKGPT